VSALGSTCCVICFFKHACRFIFASDTCLVNFLIMDLFLDGIIVREFCQLLSCNNLLILWIVIPGCSDFIVSKSLYRCNSPPISQPFNNFMYLIVLIWFVNQVECYLLIISLVFLGFVTILGFLNFLRNNL